jgi:SAM-dependent methyltransferase
LEFEEFRIMYEAEDTHCWYRGLRGVLFLLAGLNEPRAKDRKILDAGCGTGGTLNALRSAGFQNLEGFDINPPALHFCKERGLSHVRIGSITDIPFDSDSFDLVISNDVLNDAGTPNEAAALTEIFRVLKPGGRVFLNLPAFNFLRGEHDIATDVARRYTKKEISRQLRQAGFRVKRVTYWNMLLFPVLALLRVFRRDTRTDTKSARSDIVLPPRIINDALTLIFKLELRLIRLFDLPFGSSVAVVGVKPARKGRRP